jgi:cation diffusion facilitator CzcD-associated flavoprotein CzcO
MIDMKLPAQKPKKKIPHVVIIGAGFGGMYVAKKTSVGRKST